MSVNLHVTVATMAGEQLGLTLSRLGAGLTSSADVHAGDTVSFASEDGTQKLVFEIMRIMHEHQRPHAAKAPTTHLVGRLIIDGKLSKAEVGILESHGFERTRPSL